MNRNDTRLLVALVGVFISVWMPPPGRAADPNVTGEVVKRFLDENTVAVVGLKPGALDAELLRPSLAKVLPAGERLVTRTTERLAAFDRALETAAVAEIYLVFSLTDRFQEMPFVVVPDTGKLDAAAMSEFLGQWQDRSFESRRIGEAVIFGSALTLARLADLQSTPPPHFDPARASVGEAGLWAILMASDDHRRAIEVMQPNLPAVAGRGEMRVLTRGIQWIAFAVQTTPDTAGHLVVQATDAGSAADLQQLAKQLLGNLLSHPQRREREAELTSRLIPAVAGDQLRLVLNPSDDAVHRVVEVMVQPVQEILVEQARNQAMTQLKQLGLAMHLHHDKHGRFPAAGTKDAEGRPLLSWRVQLLPFIDEADLYREFRLDEPWDSEHNRLLIPRMPEVFRTPISRNLPSDGLANYAVPGGDKTMFPSHGAIAISDVTDGISNTIMTVEVADEQAEIWTKPGGYTIDPENPLRGLGGHFGDVFLSGRGDGSVQALPLDVPKETLNLLFTRDDGQEIKW